MSLLYDFDIVHLPLGDDRAVDGRVRDGSTVVARARFRNVKTSDALRGASPKIRQMFQDAGFDLEAHLSGIGQDVFTPEDRPDRDQILRALFRNIKQRGLAGEYCGAFDLWQFLDHIRRAQPVAGLVSVEQGQPVPPAPKDAPKRNLAVGRIGFALGLAVILFALLKFFQAAGASP